MNPILQETPMLIESLDREFQQLHLRSCQLIESISPDDLYSHPATLPGLDQSTSVGELALRSVAVVEQTFGGITANLWDDPFEWTLPETLPTPAAVLEYFAEVEDTRERAFLSFAADDVLLKEIAVPSGETQPLFVLLLKTLVRASDYHGRAIATLKNLNAIRPSGFNI
jgi:hypothetical protein